VVDSRKRAWVCQSQPGLADLGVVVCLCRSWHGLAVLEDLGLDPQLVILDDF
jgi:hypothetical protein